MEAIAGLGFIVLCGWIIIKTLQLLWPVIKFASLFVGAIVVAGAWFVFKEESGLAKVLGAIAVVVTAFKFAKPKS